MWRDAGSEATAFDAVHASAFPYAWPIACAWRLARRLHVPFFVTPFLHLGDPANPGDPTRGGYTSGALRWLMRQADAVFVQTEGEKEAAGALGVSVPTAERWWAFARSWLYTELADPDGDNPRGP